MYVGPERHQQREQAAWEIMQAKKIQKAQVHQSDETAMAQKQPFATVSTMNLPTTSERQHGASCFRGSAFPMKTAILFTLLLMASPACAAVEVKPGPRGKCITIYTNNCNCMDVLNQDWSSAPIVDECVNNEKFILEYKPVMVKEVAMPEQYPEAHCPNNFPTFPTVKCPNSQAFAKDFVYAASYGDIWSLPARVRQVEGITDTLIAFINKFNKASEAFHACLTPYLEKKQQEEKAETERRLAATERQNAELLRQNEELAKQYAEIMRQNAEIILMKTEEQNKGAVRQALVVIKEITEYLNEHMKGKNYQLNPRYKQAFDFFLKNPVQCISDPDEECKRELATINNIEVISQAASDEEFIRELTDIDLREQTTGL